MAFTGILGRSNARLGNFAFGRNDPPGFDPVVTQNLNLTQTVECEKTLNLSVSHTLTFTQHAYHAFFENVSHTLTFTQTATCVKLKNGIASSTLVPTQTLSRVLIASRDVQQGMALTHQVQRSVYRNKSVTQPLTLTQTAVGVQSKKTSSTLVLTQTADVTVGKHIHQFVELTQSVNVSPIYNRALFSVLGLGQVVSRQLFLQRPVTQTLTLTQVATGVVVKAASNVLALTQVAVGITAKPANDILEVYHAVEVSKSVAGLADNFVDLQQSATATKSKAVSAHHYMGFNQVARGTKRITVTAENTLVLSQDLVRDRTLESVNHTVALTQTATVSKRASPSAISSLALSHTVSVSKTYVRSVHHTLVFQNSFQRYVGIGTGGQYVSVPALQVVKVKKLVVLQSDSLVVTLPAPEFNDSEAGTGRINIKRTMSGGRRVYKRDNLTSKLVYNFILDRRKAIELRNFILNSNSKVLRMENWKGELWYVQMINSPFSFGEDAAWLGSPGGNKASISLEFEGVRTN